MKTVSKIYVFIGQNTSDSIDKDWKSAEVKFEVLDGYVGTNGTYTNLNGQIKPLDIMVFDHDLDNDLLDLLEITEGEGQKPWNKAVFRMDSDSNFDMEFIWDQEYQDEIDRLNKE